MSSNEISIRFRSLPVAPGGRTTININPYFSKCFEHGSFNPHQVNEKVVTIRVELDAPETFFLTKVAKFGSTSILPNTRTSPDHYELLRSPLGKSESLQLHVCNEGEVPAVCSGTLIVEPVVVVTPREVSVVVERVAAGQTFELVVDPFEGAGEDVSAYRTIALSVTDRNSFGLVDVRLLTEKPSFASGASILGPDDRIARVDMRRGAKLVVLLKNLSTDTMSTAVKIYGQDIRESGEPSNQDEVIGRMNYEANDPDILDDETCEVGLVEGFLRKCRGWFAEGFAAGVAGRASREEVANLVSSAPTVRESLRVLTMQLASVVEIPLVAARMYWNQVAGLGEPARRAVLSTGKVGVGPGESAKIVVSSPWRFRPTGISVDDRSAPYFTITDIKVGQDSQPQSTCGGLPCSLFAASARPALELDMDDAGPDKDVTLWVRNESSTQQSFSGAILAIVLP